MEPTYKNISYLNISKNIPASEDNGAHFHRCLNQEEITGRPFWETGFKNHSRKYEIYKKSTFSLWGSQLYVTILVGIRVYKNCCSIYCVGGWGLDPYYNSMVSSCCDPFPSISTPDKTLCVQLSLSLFKLSLFDPGTT